MLQTIYTESDNPQGFLMAGTLPPISKEQGFLETYFQYVGQLAYDRAKDACEREREAQRASGATTWNHLVNYLAQLALAEKTYTSLVFLGQKWFVRKDNLRSTYSVMATELRKMEEDMGPGVGKATVAASDPNRVFEELLGHLCGQLYEFLTARIKMMDFFEQMAVMGTNRNMNYEDLLRVILDIAADHQKSFHHPILGPIKHNFSLECEVLQHLLQAQLAMATCSFLHTLLHLNEAHGKLAVLAALPPSRETRKLNFGSSKTPSLPALVQWLGKYKALLVAKFGLYFHDVLSRQGELRPLLSKTTVDFQAKIMAFQKRSDANSVALILEARGLEGWKRGAGYHHPDAPSDMPQGLHSYPAIFTYPLERPSKHWPGLISIMTDRTAELTTIDKHIYFCDEKLQVTYFLCRIEPRITLAVIFECKKHEKDSYVNNFLVDIITQMRGSKLFASLRPGK